MATAPNKEPILLKSFTFCEDEQWNNGIRQNNHPNHEMYYLQHNFRQCGLKIKTGDSNDEDEMEIGLANVVGAYTYYSAYHQKIHGNNDDKSFIGDCFECMRDFFSAAERGLNDLQMNMGNLVNNSGWKQMTESNVEHATKEEESRREFIQEREQQQTGGLQKLFVSNPHISSPEPTPMTQTSPPQSLHQPKQDYRRSPSPHNNPPSIILTEVKDAELLSGDTQSFHKKWDEWCATAFDQHKLPPKFKSENISRIKQLGRKSICLSFFERPKRYLIDYFLHRMKENRACVFGKYQQDYSSRNNSTYTSSSSTVSQPRTHSYNQQFTPPRRLKPHSYYKSPPQQQSPRGQSYRNFPPIPPNNLPLNPTQRHQQFLFDRRGTPYFQEDRLSRVEEQLQHISNILSRLTMQTLW